MISLSLLRHPILHHYFALKKYNYKIIQLSIIETNYNTIIRNFGNENASWEREQELPLIKLGKMCSGIESDNGRSISHVSC